jgi:hypothetical protein
LLLTNSIVTGNTAGFAGGGMLVTLNADATIINTTIAGNSGTYAGGIQITGSAAVILTRRSATSSRRVRACTPM